MENKQKSSNEAHSEPLQQCNVIGSPISEVFAEDCLPRMKLFRDKEFDLAFIDPPYGINAPNMSMGSNPNRNEKGQYGGTSTAKKLKGRLNSGGGKLKNRMLNKSEIDWDNEIPSDEYFNELFRISKNQIIFGGNYFPILWKNSTRGIGYWNKIQPWDNFSQFELIWTSFDCPAFEIKLSNRGGNNAEEKIHPTQKPVELYHKLINKFCSENDKIIDTHLGSGSSRIACYNADLDFVGFEKNIDYFNLQEKRFETVLSIPRLFKGFL